MAPTAGVIDHVTAEFAVFCRLAVNCCVWPADSMPVSGLTDTLTGGNSVTVALPDAVVSAWLVAVTVTCCDAATAVGAV
jgi:hypothetical protein